MGVGVYLVVLMMHTYTRSSLKWSALTTDVLNANVEESTSATESGYHSLPYLFLPTTTLKPQSSQSYTWAPSY